MPGPSMIRTALLALLALLAMMAAPAAAQPSAPRLQRILIATVGAADPARVAADYRRHLGYVRRGEGLVSAELAESWGTPAMKGRRYILLSPRHDKSVAIRIVGVDVAPDYRASSSSGWNAMEIIVDDIDRLYTNFRLSAFVIARSPASPVPGFPTIRSMEAEGPAHETLYLTAETGDRSRSILPKPSDPVGRPFVSWLTGLNIIALRDWYASHFGMAPFPVAEKKGEGPLSGATMPNTVLLMKQPGNLLQFEGNPAQFGERPVGPGQLPPGNAMMTFEVDSLDNLDLSFVGPVRRLYDGKRAATCIDPNGNRVELVEARR